jgi:LAO/AO transport system kinase
MAQHEDKTGRLQPAAGGSGPLTVDACFEGVRAGNRAVLARAITLIESSHPERRKMAAALLRRVLPFTGGASNCRSWRIGVTGAPGVGKSTTIDQFGINLIEAGHKVAVLAVDPSSTRTGGSILGDKTRMERLSRDERAFIRPSPSSGALGGVARATRETMALCEAAGFDVIIVETVGVGQSETAVAGMVDFFLVLLQPGAGDELQGIKKGVAELADMIVINKADGGAEARARITAADYRAALHMLTPRSPHWRPPVITISAIKNIGLDEMWKNVAAHREAMTAAGAFEERRAAQAVQWMHEMIDEGLRSRAKADARIAARLAALETAVREGRTTPGLAADEILRELDFPPRQGARAE